MNAECICKTIQNSSEFHEIRVSPPDRQTNDGGVIRNCQPVFAGAKT